MNIKYLLLSEGGSAGIDCKRYQPHDVHKKRFTKEKQRSCLIDTTLLGSANDVISIGMIGRVKSNIGYSLKVELVHVLFSNFSLCRFLSVS